MPRCVNHIRCLFCDSTFYWPTCGKHSQKCTELQKNSVADFTRQKWNKSWFSGIPLLLLADYQLSAPQTRTARSLASCKGRSRIVSDIYVWRILSDMRHKSCCQTGLLKTQRLLPPRQILSKVLLIFSVKRSWRLPSRSFLKVKPFCCQPIKFPNLWTWSSETFLTLHGSSDPQWEPNVRPEGNIHRSKWPKWVQKLEEVQEE